MSTFLIYLLCSEVHIPLIPTFYCAILLMCLLPLFVVITWHIIQIVHNEYKFNKLNQKRVGVSLNLHDTLIFAQVCMKKKLWFSSIKVLESQTTTDLSIYAKCCNLIGLSYYGIKQYNMSEIYYLKAYSLNKDYVPALQNLASLYEVSKDLKSALRIYNLILENDPKNILANQRIFSLK